MGVALSKSFVKYTSGIISSCSFSTNEIARHVSKKTGHDFNTSVKGLNYLLCNDRFQVDDRYWRMHINMVFDLMAEQDLINENEKIFIQIDFTSNKNYFLIMCASIIVKDRAVPLYFTMRNYPQKKDQYDHKKMELAFIKGLRHILSKKYSYVIVADRGFGNDRFIKACNDNGFDYLIRTTADFKVKNEHDGEGIVKNLALKDGTYTFQALTWQKKITLHKVSKNKKDEWYLLSNSGDLSHLEAQKIYENRFKIEKCFQDLKSSGFEIEKSKIRKYSNYKRLLSMTMLAHVLIAMLGYIIKVKLPFFLKKSCLTKDSTLAYSSLEERLSISLKSGN
jgi:transposase